ncbi:hypothetical protein [Prosthecomicrobium sp. N25]|uniref:hypothetical protein n=1 Tax=Prosthecomicrobium sp. N25 TaxID=3129254 RepID=UPI003077707E
MGGRIPKTWSGWSGDHMLADVNYYWLVIGGEEWFLVDFFRAVVRWFGIDEWATRRPTWGWRERTRWQ